MFFKRLAVRGKIPTKDEDFAGKGEREEKLFNFRPDDFFCRKYGEDDKNKEDHNGRRETSNVNFGMGRRRQK